MKSKTKAEEKHLGLVASLGCIVTECGAPAICHHIRTGVGMGRKASTFETIPLCPRHHQGGGYGISYHDGAKAWQEKYGFERELLRLTYQLLSERGYYPPKEAERFIPI